jgi:hypothetical protein
MPMHVRFLVVSMSMSKSILMLRQHKHEPEHDYRRENGHEHEHTVNKALRNSDVDNGGANQTTGGLEISYSHVLWFRATVVNIDIWRIPTWLF